MPSIAGRGALAPIKYVNSVDTQKLNGVSDSIRSLKRE